MLNIADAHTFDSEVGHFVSENHRIIATIIKEYDPTLELVWIPPDKRAFNDEYPFALTHKPGIQPPYIVRKLKEHEVNAQLIAYLWTNDLARDAADVKRTIEALENAEKAIQMRKTMEAREEANDLAVSILGGKNYYKHNGKKYV